MPSPTGTRPKSGGRRILVVEDHADTMRGLVRLLEFHGHAVTGAGTCGEAVALIGDADRGFDLVVTDLGLRDGDGCDVIRAFRAARPAAAVIVLTAFGMPNDVRRAELAGADRVLVKPMGSVELPTVIAELTGGPGA